MRLAVVALLAGEGALGCGLWMAWPPLTPIVLGAQLVAFGLARETGGAE